MTSDEALLDLLTSANRAHLAKQMTPPAVAEKIFYQEANTYIKNKIETTSFSLQDIKNLVHVEQTALSSQLNMLAIAKALNIPVSTEAEQAVKSGMSRIRDAVDALASLESFDKFEVAVRRTAEKDFDKFGIPTHDGFSQFATGQITSLRNQNKNTQLPDYIQEFNNQRIKLIQKILSAYRNIEFSFMQEFVQKYPNHEKSRLFMESNNKLYPPGKVSDVSEPER
ncbi:MAG: hypothetical protein IJ228_04225 [Succinivibrio sp.]|nr:hypothetical protein [Succinivibrio sp.]